MKPDITCVATNPAVIPSNADITQSTWKVRIVNKGFWTRICFGVPDHHLKACNPVKKRRYRVLYLTIMQLQLLFVEELRTLLFVYCEKYLRFCQLIVRLFSRFIDVNAYHFARTGKIKYYTVKDQKYFHNVGNSIDLLVWRVSRQNVEWTDNLCEKINNCNNPKEIWQNFRALTSYQNMDLVEQFSQWTYSIM